MIAFLGSVFSPYYAWARRRGAGDPMRHCALNVALYGRGGKRWAMTERGEGAVQRDADSLAIGRSRLSWDGAGLTVRIDERTMLGRRIRGTVRLQAPAIETRTLSLDAAGRHTWRPIAPCARAEVSLDNGLSWSGPAYLDTNRGERPLEQDFRVWDWCRAPSPGGTAVLYDVTRRDGTHISLAMRYDAAGGVADVAAPPYVQLRPTLWRVTRRIGAETVPSVVETLEDTPFYARSVVNTRLLGHDVTALHESLSMDRFSALLIQAMLPFRMPRAFF